jgi:hypothetical protein
MTTTDAQTQTQIHDDGGRVDARQQLTRKRRYTITANAQMHDYSGRADTRPRRMRRWFTTEAQMHDHGGCADGPRRPCRYMIKVDAQTQAYTLRLTLAYTLRFTLAMSLAYALELTQTSLSLNVHRAAPVLPLCYPFTWPICLGLLPPSFPSSPARLSCSIGCPPRLTSLATSITANRQSLEGLFFCKLDTGRGGSDLDGPELVVSRAYCQSRERMASYQISRGLLGSNCNQLKSDDRSRHTARFECRTSKINQYKINVTYVCLR